MLRRCCTSETGRSNKSDTSPSVHLCILLVGTHQEQRTNISFHPDRFTASSANSEEDDGFIFGQDIEHIVLSKTEDISATRALNFATYSSHDLLPYWLIKTQ